MKKRYLMLLTLAALSVGCSQAKSSAPPYFDSYASEDKAAGPGDMAGDMAGEGYGYEADDVDFDAAPRAELASPAPTPPAEPSDSQPAAGGDDGAQPAIEDHTKGSAARQIVYTATMSVSVFNVSDALELAEALPERHGGWVANMTGETLVLKVPSKNLRAVMDELAAMGIVEHRTLQSQDVSDRYYDLETRIAVLEKTQVQMMDLLSKGRDVTEALSVRKALDEITMELEVLKGQMRKLKNLVSYSTLTLSLMERGPHDPTPSSNDPFPWVDELGVEATEWR